MQATFQLDASELNNNFIEAIKKAFSGKKISIIISDNEDTVLTPFEAKILASAKSTKRYVFEGDEFERFTAQVLMEEEIDSTQYIKTNHGKS
jgi:transcriptional regulator CtsR